MDGIRDALDETLQMPVGVTNDLLRLMQNKPPLANRATYPRVALQRAVALRASANPAMRAHFNRLRKGVGLLRLDARELHHLTPLLSFFSDELAEVGGI